MTASDQIPPRFLRGRSRDCTTIVRYGQSALTSPWMVGGGPFARSLGFSHGEEPREEPGAAYRPGSSAGSLLPGGLSLSAAG
ncbi:hypothetical protein [Streptomyces sp. NPDC059076]|uniref:hypothetical protein n=1 Tax=unclassified Streptomyces TaxID=2593676 RepID=UPI00367FAA97